MSRGLHSVKREISRLRPSSDFNICNSCLQTIQRRYASSAAVAQATSVDTQIPNTEPSPIPSGDITVKAGLVLSRPPLITRDPTPFEKAFYFYQRRLNERLALPFTRYFYYQRDTPADADWKKKIKQRLTPSRDIGVYDAYGQDNWNDELLVGAKESEPSEQVEALIKDSIIEESVDEHDGPVTKKEAVVERPMPKTTEADKAGDVRSLNRALSRTLYLVVQSKKDGHWQFPSCGLIGKESLQRAAERLIVETGGVNMNTWVVGNAPVGHFVEHPEKTLKDGKVDLGKKAEKTFYMKARIMAGQLSLSENKHGASDYKWLAKDELEKEVHPRYWRYVKNMLVAQ